MPLSETVLNRIDHVLDKNPVCDAALATFYELWGKLERVDRELHSELDGAWIDVLYAIREAVWLDGWACGQSPALLLTEPVAEPTPFEWVAVPGVEGVAIGLTADQFVGELLARGAL
jgi:hypothetical protein